MAFMFKYKCCERTISYPLHYMKEAIHYEGENVNLTLMHALRLLKKKLKSHRLKGIEESSVELKLDSRPSSLESSQELSSESARISLIDPLGSADSVFNDETINLCKIINSVSRFSYYTYATSTNISLWGFLGWKHSGAAGKAAMIAKSKAAKTKTRSR
uniref:Uncharacterized protein n=1 Tax=Rhodnius prolixus TaxID=13249 RepID=T1I8L6_RHOPR